MKRHQRSSHRLHTSESRENRYTSRPCSGKTSPSGASAIQCSTPGRVKMSSKGGCAEAAPPTRVLLCPGTMARAFPADRASKRAPRQTSVLLSGVQAIAHEPVHRMRPRVQTSLVLQLFLPRQLSYFRGEPLHVNATNVSVRIEPQGGGSVRELARRRRRLRTGADSRGSTRRPGEQRMMSREGIEPSTYGLRVARR